MGGFGGNPPPPGGTGNQPPQGGPGGRPPGPPPASVPPNVNDVTTVSVGIGVGVGFGVCVGVYGGGVYGSGGYGNWYCPPPSQFTTCFGGSWCYPDPFCYSPCYYPNYWRCDPWGGWYANWSCWPSYWWYPSWYYRSYPCGTWWNVGYCAPYSSWSFNFCSTPVYSSCGLVSVGASYYDDGWSYSTNGLYKYGWFPSSVTVLSTEPDPSLIVVQESGPAVADGSLAIAPLLPAPATEEQLRGNSQRSLGDTYLRLGDIPNAIRVLANQVTAYPGDVQSLRTLGLAYIANGQVSDGNAAIERAYMIDPQLAMKPMPGDILGEQARLVRAIDACIEFASRENTASAWFGAAVLMQADGRPGPSRSALDKARTAGLSGPVLEWMQSALPVGQ